MKTTIKFLIVNILVLIQIFNAQWTADPTINTAISTATNNQVSPLIISDDSGGAIITWTDYRNGSNYDIYAQRINSAGAVQWTSDGVAICTAADNQGHPMITSDGSGGAIITWEDYRNGANYDIYAQRINSAGVVQWTANGVAISTAWAWQYGPMILSDGSGGAIITWEDYRNGSNYDIYAQRINSAGVVQWTADGITVSTAADEQVYPMITSDGSGGAIITWEDKRNGANNDIYAQRINSAGVVQWTADGVAISTATNNQVSPLIISDDSGGAIITWTDYRNGSNYDIYAQRINSAGAVQWTSDGVAICTAADNQGHPMITSDGSGGAIITWEDYRNGANYDIYAQRINSAGVVQWTANGVAISTAWAWQYGPMILSDGSGGAIITWEDYRNGSNYDIYAQRINSAGVVQWTADGITVSTAADEQVYPMITSDGSGGAIITWEDKRNGANNDIYSTRLFSDGSLPIQLGSFTANINSFNNHVILEWMTITETNCYGFEIERRENISKNSWLNVGFVPGNGNTNSPKLYSFTDKISSSDIYIYRLKQIDRDGKFTYSHEVYSVIATSKTFTLNQNYPNPFNPSTVINYQLPVSSFVSLKIFDLLGREVTTLVNEQKNTGNYSVQWNAKDLSSGIYFYRMLTESFSEVKKMILMK